MPSVPPAASYSRAYLHHTVKAGEIIASMLLTWHNLAFYQNLMTELRAAIAESQLMSFAADFIRRYNRLDTIATSH